LTRGLGAAKAWRVTGGVKLPDGRAGESSLGDMLGEAPKEQPPPESLRPKDRARFDSLESVRRSLVLRWTAEGAKLSGAKDRRGRWPMSSLKRWLSSPFVGAPE